MRQNTLLNVRQMFKSEMGWSLDPSISKVQDTEINYNIYNVQNWLASEYDWGFLRKIIDVGIPGGAQYSTLPNLNYERATQLIVEVFYNQIYLELAYGIDSREYNISNYSINQSQTPCERWSFYSENQFELWPVSLVAQTVRFTGQAPLTTLFIDPAANPLVFDDTAKINLDDLLVVYFATAAEMQRLKDPRAQDSLTKATKRLADLKASYPTRENRISVRGNTLDGLKTVRAIPIVTVAPLAR